MHTTEEESGGKSEKFKTAEYYRKKSNESNAGKWSECVNSAYERIERAAENGEFEAADIVQYESDEQMDFIREFFEKRGFRVGTENMVDQDDCVFAWRFTFDWSEPEKR